MHVVLDRDGTLIKHVHYLSDPDEVCILPGVVEGIKKLQLNNISFSLHTNQSGVGRNYFSMEAVTACNKKMLSLLNIDIEAFQEICIAPEAPDQKLEYRKPSPKFGNEIIKEYNYDVDRIFYIGDTLSDYLTAVNVGCNFIGVDTGLVKLSLLPREEIQNIIIKKNFNLAIEHVLENL